MSIIFCAGLPRSSTLGFADLFCKNVDHQEEYILMTGHLHLAAALSDHDIGQFDSPLNLYKSHESLIRCLLNLHGMSFSIDTFSSMFKYYSSSTQGYINSKRLKIAVQDPRFIFIDPSFSHSLHPNYLLELSDVSTDMYLVVIWRNPIYFCLDIMHGVFSLDSCLQWILAKKDLSFPLDPLSLWLEFVKPFVQLLDNNPSSFKNILCLHAENIVKEDFSLSLNDFSFTSGYHKRSSNLSRISPLFTDCPFSGDPSYYLNDKYHSCRISFEELSRYSSDQSVINEVAALSKKIGYTLID